MSNPVREALKAWVRRCEDPEERHGEWDENGPGTSTAICGCEADWIWKNANASDPDPFPHKADCLLNLSRAALASEETPDV